MRGALGIVLVGGRQAEEPSDAVTHVRLNRAAELLDGPRHPVDALADQRLDLIRRQALSESRRANDVREEGGYGPKLVGRADTGRTAVARRFLGACPLVAAKRHPAIRTEPCLAGDCCAAFGAAPRVGRPPPPRSRRLLGPTAEVACDSRRPQSPAPVSAAGVAPPEPAPP